MLYGLEIGHTMLEKNPEENCFSSEQEGTSAKPFFFNKKKLVSSDFNQISKIEPKDISMFSCWHSKLMANEYPIKHFFSFFLKYFVN